MKHGFLGALSLFFCLAVSSVQAQERRSYFGIGVSYATYTGGDPNYPLPSIQVGGPISETLELRGTLESIAIISNLGLDLLYPVMLEDADARFYLGGGANSRFFAYYPIGFDLRLILGGEYFFESSSSSLPSGLFGETRIYFRGLLNGFPTLEGRVGLNLPF